MKTWSPLRVVGLAFLLYQAAEAAAARCQTAVATLVSLQGDVTIRAEGHAQWQSPELGASVCPGDTVRVGRASRAGLAIGEHTLIRLDADSLLVLPPAETPDGFWVRLQQGLAHLISRISTELTVRTAFANAGVEGTEFLVHAGQTQAVLDVIEGRVAFENEKGVVRVRSGERALAVAGQPPALTIPVRPTDAVQWAMHFPNLAARTRAPPWLIDAQQALASGQRNNALAALDRATEASTDQADVQAMLAIIAVVDNRTQVALDHAEAAVQLAPDAPRALLALSYAYQANGRLGAARVTATAAVAESPDDPVLLSRQAELQLADDDPAAAATTAARANTLAPAYSRPHALRGFAALAQGNDQDASAAFDQAIALDSADPLPRIGRALVLIRMGDLPAGRRQLEIAVSLAPASAVTRAYLGKAYAAENRDKRAAEQYAIARELDPLDPTAYFYEAVLLTTQNRPIEALQSLEAAAEKNPNRRVYRSSLAADSDQAARQAATARVYQSLGFDVLAEEAAAEALARAPADPAAHRFRADVLSSDRRQGVAKASETLQAQLLQPLNLYPVPPTLGVSNINILRDAGPQLSGINEYHTLFRRDGGVFQVTGVAGNHDSFGDEILAGLVSGHWALHATQFHYRTDGFRPNAHNREDIATVFAQHQLSGQTSVQAEVRRHDRKRGDIGLEFHPDTYSADQLQKDRTDAARLGVRHQANAKTVVLASVVYTEKTFVDTFTEKPIPILLIDSQQRSAGKGFNSEVQLIRSNVGADWIAGIGHYRNTDTEDTDAVFFLNGAFFQSRPFDARTTVSHSTAYSYGLIDAGSAKRWVLGLSADNLKAGPLRRQQINPKVGVVWNVTRSTKVRAAGFRTLQRSLVSPQTLEPTEVAGFTQFWDDPLGADAHVAALAVSHKVSKTVRLGAEAMRREIDFQVGSGSSLGGQRQQTHDLARAYVNWTPAPRFGVAVGYDVDRLTEHTTTQVSTNRPIELATHRFPMAFSYYHPSGWHARLTPAYHRQRGQIKTASGPPTLQKDDFWLLDATVGYRLPKRRGAIVFSVANVFDETFNFRDVDFVTGDVQAPLILPARSIALSVTLPFN